MALSGPHGIAVVGTARPHVPALVLGHADPTLGGGGEEEVPWPSSHWAASWTGEDWEED